MFYKLLYPFYFRRRYKQPYEPLKNLLSESQYWSAEEMKEYQDKQLELLQKAASGTDHYSEKFRGKGIKIINTDNILSLGPLSKETLKNHPEKLVNINVREYNIYRTSGTAGTPLKIRVSPNAEALRTAGRKRYYDWWGISPADRSILIWGRSKYHHGKTSFMGRIEMRFSKIHKISVFDLSSEIFPSLIRKIRRYKPKYFRGYTSGIEQFADLCTDYKTDLHDLKLKGVIVTSEILTPGQREKIKSVFGCPVINEYGANDGGLIAFECPSGGMHIFEEALFLNTKANGELLLTDLHNHATPLINYELGDRIQLKEGICVCGRQLRMIELIEGRTGDFIEKSNGQKLNNAFFDYVIRDLDSAGFHDAIFKYKVVQRGKVFDFYYVKGNLFSRDVEAHIKKIMLSEIGGDLEINFIEVPEIKREESGKLRDFVREF